MTLLLFCGTALAAVEVQPGDDSSVTVTKKDADEKVFTVTKSSGVSDGQLYLVMIQKGNASDMPTAENLYYLNVEKASGTTFTMDAYPKDLDGGTYVVYLSDYAGANGGRNAVATLLVDIDEPKYGDVNGDNEVTGKDRIILSRYLAKWADYGEDKTDANYKVVKDNADVNKDGQLTGKDRIILSRHLAKWADYQTLPMPES